MNSQGIVGYSVPHDMDKKEMLEHSEAVKRDLYKRKVKGNWNAYDEMETLRTLVTALEQFIKRVVKDEPKDDKTA